MPAAVRRAGPGDLSKAHGLAGRRRMIQTASSAGGPPCGTTLTGRAPWVGVRPSPATGGRCRMVRSAKVVGTRSGRIGWMRSARPSARSAWRSSGMSGAADLARCLRGAATPAPGDTTSPATAGRTARESGGMLVGGRGVGCERCPEGGGGPGGEVVAEGDDLTVADSEDLDVRELIGRAGPDHLSVHLELDDHDLGVDRLVDRDGVQVGHPGTGLADSLLQGLEHTADLLPTLDAARHAGRGERPLQHTVGRVQVRLAAQVAVHGRAVDSLDDLSRARRAGVASSTHEVPPRSGRGHLAGPGPYRIGVVAPILENTER